MASAAMFDFPALDVAIGLVFSLLRPRPRLLDGQRRQDVDCRRSRGQRTRVDDLVWSGARDRDVAGAGRQFVRLAVPVDFLLRLRTLVLTCLAPVAGSSADLSRRRDSHPLKLMLRIFRRARGRRGRCQIPRESALEKSCRLL